MVKTQIQLTKKQICHIKRLAESRQVSISEVIRKSVDTYLRNELSDSRESKRKRALKVAGGFSSGCKNLSLRHDDYLAEAYR